MKRFFLLLIITSLGFSCFSQNKFQMSLGQSGKDFNALNAIKRLADGYIMVGTSGSTSTNLNDLVIMKTDLNMNIVWSKSIGTSAFDEKIEYLSKCVVFETDGIVILGGTTQPGTRDFLLTKVDYSGGLIWAKSYGCPISGTNYDDNASALCKTSTGYYLCGYLNTASTGYGLVIKVDNGGTQVWSKYFVPQSANIANLWTGLNLSTNDLVVSGGYGNGPWEAFLIKISSTGTILWQKNFTKSNYDDIYDMVEDQDYTLLCAMMHDGYYTAARGALLNVDLADGTLLWAKNYDLDIASDRDGQMNGVFKNPDHTTMISFIYSNAAAGAFKSDIAVAKLDASANVVWAKKYATNDGDAWPKMYPNNGSYLICAEQANNRYPSEHFYLLGLNSDGKSGCNETTLTPVVSTLTGYQWLDFSTSLQTLSSTSVAQSSLASNTISMDKNVFCVNTGVGASNAIISDYKIFPNPSHEELFVTSTARIESIEISNNLGQLVASNSNKSSINIHNLAKGTYFVKVNNEFYVKFIKE